LHRVELGHNAKVHGNVEYGLIEMAIGAEVNGKLVHASESGLAQTAGSQSATIRPDEELPPDGSVEVIGEST
jgi:cytoskeletal protein CcmA (bactofilin family)